MDFKACWQCAKSTPKITIWSLSTDPNPNKSKTKCMAYRQPGILWPARLLWPKPELWAFYPPGAKNSIGMGIFFVLSVSLVKLALKKQISTNFSFFRLELWTDEQSARFSTKISRLLPKSISRDWLKWSTQVTPHIVGYLSLFQNIQMNFSQCD